MVKPNLDCTFLDDSLGLENHCYSKCRASFKDGECVWKKCPAKGDKLFNHCALDYECRFHDVKMKSHR